MMRAFMLCMVFSVAHAADAPEQFAYQAPLALSGQGPFYRYDVPQALYEGIVRADLGDLRVFNANGEAVPHAFLPRAAATTEKRPAIDLPMFPIMADRDAAALDGLSLTLTRNAGGTSLSVRQQDGTSVAGVRRVGYVVDASAVAEPLAALRVMLPASLRGRTVSLRVDGSDDLVRWRSLVPSVSLMDLEYGGQRLVQDRIELGTVKVKYLRLSPTGGSGNWELASVQGEAGERSLEPVRQWKQVTAAAASGTASPEGVAYDSGGVFPIDRATLKFAQVNTILPAPLAVRTGDKQPWRTLGEITFYRLSQPGGEVENLALALSSGGARYWLLRPDPNVGYGREPPALVLGWIPHAVVFVARGPAPFSIAYGSATATSTSLPVATLIPGFDSSPDVLAQLGSARSAAVLPAGHPERLRAAIDWKHGVLWAVLILGVGVLGWMAWQLSRKLGSSDSVAPKGGADNGGAPPA